MSRGQASYLSTGLLTLGLYALLSACAFAIPGKIGTKHHLIIGLGIVSVNESPDEGIVATDAQALGISISDRPAMRLGIGYSSDTVLTVTSGAEDVRVELSKKPWGPLVVDTQKALFRNTQ